MGWPGGHLCLLDLLVQVPVPYEPRIKRIMKETPEKRVVGCWDLGGDPPKWMDILKWIPGHIFSSWVLKKNNGILWHEKLDQFWCDSCDDLNNTRGSTLVAHFATFSKRIGKSDTKNIFSLKWWGFEMVNFHLPWNHGISANKSPFEKKTTTTKTYPSHVMDDPFSQKTSVEFSTPKMKGN